MVPSVVLAFVIAGIALAGFGAVAAFAFFASDLPSPEELARDPLAQTTNVFDRDGTDLLYQFEVERREVIPLAEVPQMFIDATVSAEDKSFWTNPGVDIFSILRAVRDDLLNQEVVSGASTITQQLVKQRIIGGEFSVTRKIKEAILAIQVTRTYSKEQILELYFNQIYYGNQAYGIKAAAQTYFGKADLDTLTLAESALLAGPSAVSLDPRPVAAGQRRARQGAAGVRARSDGRLRRDHRGPGASRPTPSPSRSPASRSRRSRRRTSSSRSATS